MDINGWMINCPDHNQKDHAPDNCKNQHGNVMGRYLGKQPVMYLVAFSFFDLIEEKWKRIHNQQHENSAYYNLSPLFWYCPGLLPVFLG